MRTLACLLAVTACAVAAAPAGALPPVHSGCGPDGPTMSALVPSVTLTSTTLRRRADGRVRIRERGTQTAAATISMTQVGGRFLGGTKAGSYTCATPSGGTISLPLNAYGRKLTARHRALPVALTFRLVNGSGVRSTRTLTAVIRPEEPAATRAAPSARGGDSPPAPRSAAAGRRAPPR